MNVMRCKKCFLFIAHFMAISLIGRGQLPDSVRTGYLLDAAEEYWPAGSDSAHFNIANRIKHLPVNNHKGFNTPGINLRETYELFDNYFWDMGPQDNNGYFLHRILLHDDFRWNRYLRVFGELQSSTVTGRNGGPRPVQDRNDLALNQAFAELSLPLSRQTLLHARAGKQYLNYGSGTLLDARDANVRRSFLGYKLIVENSSTRVDAFLMELAATRPGSFDDVIDHSQKIAGIWATQKMHSRLLTRLDLYYLYIQRDPTKFNQGTGEEKRHTFGTGIYYKIGNWSGFTEFDLQWGKFAHGTILAWKIAPSITWQCPAMLFRPVFSLQGAMSSGDRTAADADLQTFNPLYPKAIFYGFIDNAGSANLMVVHPKIELMISKKLRLAGGFYKFWRASAGDGLYAVNGAFLLPDVAGSKNVGTMLDFSAVYTLNEHCSFQAVSSFYQRGDFLKQQAVSKGDIRYLSVKATVRI